MFLLKSFCWIFCFPEHGQLNSVTFYEKHFYHSQDKGPPCCEDLPRWNLEAVAELANLTGQEYRKSLQWQLHTMTKDFINSNSKKNKKIKKKFSVLKMFIPSNKYLKNNKNLK